jgi:hypothetical protein
MPDRPGQEALGQQLAHPLVGNVAAAVPEQMPPDEAEFRVVRTVRKIEIEDLGKEIAHIAEVQIGDQGQVIVAPQTFPVSQKAVGQPPIGGCD